MAKRFNNLKAALRYIQSPTGGSDNEPPSGSILRNYKDFRDGKTVPSYPRAESSKPGTLAEVTINPFGYTLNANPAIVKVSQRALDTATAGVRTACNHDTVDTATDSIIERFMPAKAVVFRADATQSSAEVTSQITGLRYNPRDGESYTLPYGQTTGELVETAVRADIITALAATEQVNFYSEKL